MHIDIIKKPNNHVKTIIKQINANPTLSLKDVLPTDIIEKHISTIECRERVFTPSVTVWSLLSQVLSDGQSCQSAVAKTIAYFINQGKKPPSSNTAAYCKARSRLPEHSLAGMANEVARQLESQALPDWSWNGKNIKLIDGSTVSMPDTIANQARYPQSASQQEGIGFPIARIAAIISFATGAVLEFAIGAYKGKEASELALIRQFLPSFSPGEIVIADSYYANYFMIALLINEKVDVVLPIHSARKHDFRRGIRLGKKDHIVAWKKPKQPAWMDKKTYDKLPACLTLREVVIEKKRKGFRTQSKVIVTTFLEIKKVSREALNELFGYRWHVELDLRCIKTTMRMDILRGKTPEMVHKEIWAHILAYNLIRKIMTQAAIQYEKNPRQLSFKLALQAVASFRQANILHDEYLPLLLKVIANKTVGNRSGRYEPRRIKRRPKPWDLLLKPRAFYHREAA